MRVPSFVQQQRTAPIDLLINKSQPIGTSLNQRVHYLQQITTAYAKLINQNTQSIRKLSQENVTRTTLVQNVKDSIKTNFTVFAKDLKAHLSNYYSTYSTTVRRFFGFKVPKVGTDRDVLQYKRRLSFKRNLQRGVRSGHSRLAQKINNL